MSDPTLCPVLGEDADVLITPEGTEYRCPICGGEVGVYETADGRFLCITHEP